MLYLVRWSVYELSKLPGNPALEEEEERGGKEITKEKDGEAAEGIWE